MSWFRELIFRNTGLKIVSLFLAFVLWMVVFQGDQRIEQPFDVPVRVVPGPNAIIMEQNILAVKVRVEGTATVLRQVLPTDIVARIPIPQEDEGELSVEISPEHLALPRDLRVLSISPQNVIVLVEPKTRKRVPIELTLVGEPAPGYRVKNSQKQPTTVLVEGAESEVAALENVPTEPVDLTGKTEVFSQEVMLAETGKRTVMLAEDVSVKVKVRIEVDPSAEIQEPEGAEGVSEDASDAT